MIYAIEGIAKTLKEARERKGLSQRALSARSGVRQYQISKIENGSVDLRLSSLIELARALDLDLKLIPRKAVPAVDHVVRSTTPKAAAAPVLKELNRTLDVVKDLRATYPDLSELNKLQNTIQSFKNLQGVGKELEALREIYKPIRELQKFREAAKLPTEQIRAIQEASKLPSEQLRALRDAARLPAEQLQALREAANAAQNLRNQLVHSISEAPSLPRPAYSLDEDDDG